MLFVEWLPVTLHCVFLLLIGSAVLAFRSVLYKKAWFRLPVQLLSGLVALGSLFSLLFYWVMPNPWTYSAPIYSPNHRMAARVAEYNASGFGGADTSVELFNYHGLFSNVVFLGEWKSVEASNIRWKSDSELDVFYQGTPYRCTSTRRAKVRCEQEDAR
jgi:hypothetical protein